MAELTPAIYCWACGGRLPGLPPLVCPSCGTSHWRNPKPCAGSLVTNEGRLMLVRRGQEPYRDCWDIPGGFCEVGEHPIQTAAREVFEETELRVEVTGLLGIWLDNYGDVLERGQAEVTFNIYYHAVPVAGSVAQPDATEIVEIGWFKPDELPAAIAFPNHIVPVLVAWRTAYANGQTTSPLIDRPR